jgi:hypothetical protein
MLLCQISLNTHHILSKHPYAMKVLCDPDFQNDDFGSILLKIEYSNFDMRKHW